MGIADIDEGTKRHRGDSSNWVYQRRGSTAQQPRPSPLSKPQIQLSTVDDRDDDAARNNAKRPHPQDADKLTPTVAEPRRFRVSKAMLAAAAAANSAGAGAISKRDRYGTPTLFVERTRRKKLAPRPRRSMMGLGGPNGEEKTASKDSGDVAAKDLKRPGVRSREAAKTKDADAEAPKPKPTTGGNPLPPSLMNRATEDMDKIAADMNDWVLREVGAGLQSQEEERKKAEPKPLSSPSRFKPKAPAKRYHERHPEVPAPGTAMDGEGDLNMTDASEEEGDDDDWVIEEYIRIPANSVAMDVAPTDVGFLVLDGEEESLLFFGPQNDEDEDWDEDEEDENGRQLLSSTAARKNHANRTSREPLHSRLP